MATRDIRTGEAPVCGPWNPGIQSQVPRELRHLATIFRADNVFTSIATVDELKGLTGISPSELVAFRPQRLALHELLIRVTADFAVPDGSRIGDLGINFREMANLLLERYLIPQMGAIAATYESTRGELRRAITAAATAADPGWGPRHLAECERLAAVAETPLQRIAYR